MSYLGDDDGVDTTSDSNSTAGTSDCETEFFGSHSSTPKALGKEGEFGSNGSSWQSTVPMDDTVIFEEAFETQLLDLPGETQVVDFNCEAQDYGETQVMDFDDEAQLADIGGETQVLDDVNCTDHIETQLVDVFGSDDGGEVSDRTEIVSDSDEREASCRDKYVETQKVLSSSVSGDNVDWSMERPATSCGEKKNSGSGPARFTSLRIASLRASSLAARRNKGVVSSPPTANLTTAKFAMELEKAYQPEKNVERNNGHSNSSRTDVDTTYRGGNQAMRKLSYDNVENEKDELTYDAGLSYIDSQEPGDLSQANALDFVDRFLKVSVAEYDQESEHGKLSKGKNTPSFNAKGPQELAKKAIKESIAGELGIYDWDDCKEDEGGGDIFCRRKVDFLGGGKRGKKYLNSEARGLQDGNERRMDVFNSDSKLLFRKPKVTDRTMSEVQKNLANDFHSQLENNAEKTDEPDILDVGPDTQIAAEAMEALFHGGDIVEEPSTSCKPTKQPSSRKKAGGNVINIPSRRSKRTRKLDAIIDDTPVISEIIWKNEVKDTEKSKPKKGRKTVQEKPEANGFESIERKRVQKMTSHSENVAHCTRSSVKPNGFESLDRRRVQKKITRSETVAHGTISSMMPIAHRTRQSSSTIHVEEGSKKRMSSGIRGLKMLTSDLNKEFEMVADFTHSETLHTFSPKRRRSLRKPVTDLSPQITKSSNVDDPSKYGIAENGSPQTKSKLSDSSCSTPVNCTIPIKDISPICMGDEYFKQLCEKGGEKKTGRREIRNLSISVLLPISPTKELRKRREKTDVRVLYSQHLDDGVIKQQKKILTRLGVSVVSSMTDATHFIADQFVRTRNMLEAIASGKPVVTHVWLESCGQANCFIDEKNYILRDAKKEKEFGFSMLTSLTCASRRPLLQGLKVLITPNTKPGIETIMSLVMAVQGLVVERISRFLLKDGVFPDNLLVLSCEEDYAICLPFLEQGAMIYSSELLLNGIVTQKLEYDRYRLFTEHVRKTRSTVWLNKDGSKFLPVAKSIKK